jgi:Zn-dependent oligopeptidase
MLEFNTNDPNCQNVSCISLNIRNRQSLTDSEVVCLFHEFGHALSSALCQSQYQQLAGTRSPEFDFVECTSLVMERLAFHPLLFPQYANQSPAMIEV